MILTMSSLLTHIPYVKTHNDGKDYFSWGQQKILAKQIFVDVLALFMYYIFFRLFIQYYPLTYMKTMVQDYINNLDFFFFV